MDDLVDITITLPLTAPDELRFELAREIRAVLAQDKYAQCVPWIMTGPRFQAEAIYLEPVEVEWVRCEHCSARGIIPGDSICMICHKPQSPVP